jgi:OOP family OmpA-OmpF porin
MRRRFVVLNDNRSPMRLAILGSFMKKTLIAAALIAMPVMANAQSLQYPGLYVGIEGGGNWLFNTTASNPALGTVSINPDFGWLAGAVIGYDFVGPRAELEGVYRENNGNVVVTGTGISAFASQKQIAIMANGYYDFNAGSTIVPYIGAGIGVSFVDANAGGGVTNSTQFAYQGMVGVGWNINNLLRLNLEGRYHGTTQPWARLPGGSISYNNNNASAMLSLHFKFGAPTMAAAPPPQPQAAVPPSFMVFFDWDRSNLSPQAVGVIQQAANAYKTKGQARITATGHADKSGPDQYNMALSLRRANAVKDQLVREGVPANVISVVGRGESMPLVQTADGVREPQNRRVEIVVQ